MSKHKASFGQKINLPAGVQRKQLGVTGTQKAALVEIFQAFSMGRATVSLDELGEMWRVLGGNPTRNDIQELFGQHDVDSDGAFTLEEFVGFMTPMMQDTTRGIEQVKIQCITEYLDTFDQDDDGCIDTGELLECLASQNDGAERLTAEEIKAVEHVLCHGLDGQRSVLEGPSNGSALVTPASLAKLIVEGVIKLDQFASSGPDAPADRRSTAAAGMFGTDY